MPALGVIFWVFIVDVERYIGDFEETFLFTVTVKDIFYLGILTGTYLKYEDFD